MTAIFVSLAIETYILHVKLIRLMNPFKKITDIGVAIGSLMGYATILAGIIMTILLLQTIITGDYI